MQTDTVGEVDREFLRRSWGINWLWWPTWPWTTRIRILFVIDGRINEGSHPDEFGLGLVLDTLRDISFAYWVRFSVTVVNRDNGFRFTEEGFDINAYDQIWFFGDWPGIAANEPDFPDSRIGDTDYSPMEDGELELIAAWMNNGGGVFATGDHSLLGASMCHRFPRVRSMRRWTHAQGVPAFGGVDRHQTLQGLPHIDPMAAEGDRYPQRIYPVLRSSSRRPFVLGQRPHPLLCGPDGVIDELPDHMHEGGLFEDDEVVLTDRLLPGSTEAEYPEFPIVIASEHASAASIGSTPGEVFRGPRPEVIAYGLTTIGAVPKRFPLLGVYDGEPVGVGRVVVDSTWHHWFSMNLVGLRDEAPGFYRNMQHYYRNVALWLATPAQRASMLFWATWGAVTGTPPGFLDPALGIFGLGERVVDVIGRTAPQCIVSELVNATYGELSVQAREVEDTPEGWDPVVRPPAEFVDRAIVGGIATGMFELARHNVNERARGRSVEFSPEEIRDAGVKGLAVGRRELRAAFGAAAARFGALADQLPDEDGVDALASQIQVGSTLDEE